MELREFVKKFICANSLIRLWIPIEGGYKMIYRREVNSPKSIDSVCMEWKLLNGEAWQSKYNSCEVVGIKDILVDDFYREAINIVIKPI